MNHKFYLTTRLLVAMLLLALSNMALAQTPTLVYDINSGANPSLADGFTVFNNKLYFAADDGSTGMELWVYDGVNNPSRVADIYSGATGSDPKGLTVFDSKLYFVADDGTNGRELWSYSGTGSPSMVANINSGSNWAFLSFNPEMIVYNNALYFIASNGSTINDNGEELWKYTGTGSPTMVYDIYSGNFGSNINSFCIYKDTLFFAADDGTNGDELWRYTGTGNPGMVYDLRSGAGIPSLPRDLTVYNGKLYFVADDGTKGIELYSYDNVNNPSIAADINTGSAGSAPSELIVYKNKLYFSADDGTTGLELYSYNGTSASLVEDIYAGLFNASFPTDFCIYNDTLYFVAGDGTSGLEVRKYGGSGSVMLVADIYSGSSGSFPLSPTVFGSSLYFQADDGVKGAEMWRITGPCGVTNTTLTIEACDEYTFNGNTYFMNNNTAKDTIMGTGGCDTIVTLNLTIKYSTYQDSFVNTCGSVTLYDSTYTTSTIVDTLLMNAAGCDSLLTYYITINNNSNRDTFVNSCNNFTWRGNTYSSSTTVVHTLPIPNSVGCDSTVTLHFTKGQTTFSYKQEETCNGYFWRGTTYTNSGFYSDTIPNSNGCDSILVLNLTINKTSTTDTFATSCGVYTWRGNTIFGGGILYDSLVSSKGCDSIVTLYVTATEPVYNEINIVQCDSADVNGTWYKDAGIYTQTLTAASGCDSILTINYAKQFGRDTMVITECKKYNINGVDYTSSGLYNIGIVGCDTTVLDLTILNDADTTDTTILLCYWYGSARFNWKNGNDSGYKYLNNYGGWSTEYVNIPRAGKCDSVIRIAFFSEYPRSRPEDGGSITVCDSVTLSGTTYNEESYKEEAENNRNGQYHTYGVWGPVKSPYSDCYFGGFYRINFHHSVTQDKNIISCQPALVGYNSFTETGEYTVRLETQYGCDSTINVNYTHLDRDTTINKDVCDRYELNGVVYTASGTYKQPVPGCSHDTITINLTIRHSSTPINDTITACDNYTWEGKTYTESIKDKRIYTNAEGCDSVRNLVLTINKPIIIIDTVEACVSFKWRGTTYTNSGIYSDTLVAMNGCDSIRRIILEIKDINIYPEVYNTSTSLERTGGWGSISQNNCMGISNNGEYLVELYFNSASGVFGNTDTRLSATISKFENDEWVEHIYDYLVLSASLDKKAEAVPQDPNIHVAVSDDGNTFAVVYKNFYMDRTDPDEKKHKFDYRTTVAVYTISGDSLKLKGAPIYLPMYNVETSIDLSADGNTLAVGTPYEIGFSNSGATVFQFNGVFWLPKGSSMSASFLGRKKGVDIDLMPNGDRVVVTGATTVNSLGGDTIQGDVIVYDWDGSSWQVFGHRIINVLTEGLVTGTTHDIFASAVVDSNILAVTRSGSDKILIYRYNSSNFTWEVTDTIKMEKAVDGRVNLQISNDAKIVTISSDNDIYRKSTLFSEVYVYDSGYYSASDKVNLAQFHVQVDANGYYDTDEENTLQRASLRLAPEVNRITFIVPSISNDNPIEYNVVKTYQFCDDNNVGIEEVTYSTNKQGVNFITYPNPTTGVFTLRVDVPETMKNEAMEYEIYNMQGMVVGRGRLNGAEGTIALEGQPQGIYFVKFQIGGYTGTAKILINN